MTTIRPGIDDGGVLILAHDGTTWGLLALSGAMVYRNLDLAAGDHAGACDWAYDTVCAIADVPPPRPSNNIPGVRVYTLNERDGQVVAELSPGVVHHDGQAWVAVDARGEVTHRRTGIGAEDQATANDWAHEIITSQPGYRPPNPNTRPATGGPVRYFDYHGSATSS